MAQITLDNISKNYGSHTAIPGLSLDIRDKEFVVLVGPSGCGKSTTLRMIAGLEDITGGTMYFDDRPVNDVSPVQRNVAMVFQNYALYPHMSVRRNLSFGLENMKLSKAEIATRVDDAAQTLGLTELLDRKPKALSGGQRQRVAMGRAIVRQPSVFLFDEPLSNLDAKLRAEMRTAIKLLHRQVDTTVVYVTHDQVEAMTLAERIVVMREGVIEQQGAPQELFDNPASAFVAGFLGSPQSNLIDGMIGEGGIFRAPDGFSLQLPPALAACARIGQEVILGLRPDDVNPLGGDQQGRLLHSGGTVEVVEPLGAESYLLVQCDGTRLLVKSQGRTPHRVGEEVGLSILPQMLMLFDRKTGKSLKSSGVSA